MASRVPSPLPTDAVDFSIFTHRLGHGIGLEGHEAPYLVQGPLGETRAMSGHVFSLEPGIYLPKNKVKRNGITGLGVRLEDCFVVTEDENGRLGGEWLTGPVEKWGDL
jgi:Xaa-Pro aminopeptidase